MAAHIIARGLQTAEVREGTNQRDAERRRAAEPAGGRNVGMHFDAQRGCIEAELASGYDDRFVELGVVGGLPGLIAADPNLEPPADGRHDRRLAVDDAVLAEEDDLPRRRTEASIAHALRRGPSATPSPFADEAIPRPCSSMWPRWIPSVARARSAAKFWPSPTAAITAARPRAPCTSSTRKARRARGLMRIRSPTVPTASGSSNRPHSRSPSTFHTASGP